MSDTPTNVSASSKRLLGRYVSDPDFAVELHQQTGDPAAFEDWLVAGGFEDVDPEVIRYLTETDQARVQQDITDRLTGSGGQVAFA